MFLHLKCTDEMEGGHHQKINEDVNLSSKVEKLQHLEMVKNGLTDEDLMCPRNTLKPLYPARAKVEDWWFQRLKYNWITRGERNYAFFHNTTSNCRRCNQINFIFDSEDQKIEVHEAFVKCLNDHFTLKWYSEISPTLNLHLLPPEPRGVLSDESATLLIEPKCALEVKEAVFSI